MTYSNWTFENLITPPTSLRGKNPPVNFGALQVVQVDSPFATSSSPSSGRFEALSRLRRSIFIIPKTILLFILYSIIIFIIYYFICLFIKKLISEKQNCAPKKIYESTCSKSTATAVTS